MGTEYGLGGKEVLLGCRVVEAGLGEVKGLGHDVVSSLESEQTT